MPLKLTTDFIKTILDPVHGPILLSPAELAVLNHRLFRRLHRIRQNGLLYYVFPAATHTRWEHSLGALHLADSIVTALVKNSTIAARKSPAAILSPTTANVGQAVDLSNLVPGDRVRSQERVDLIRVHARLAALVHDLGHGPLSHTFDKFALKTDSVRQILETAPELESVRGLSSLLAGSDGRVKHEVMSCILFALIAADLDLGPTSLPRDIAAIVLGKPELSDNEELRELLPLLSDIVASAPADADRMDYLERDSRSLGVSYGLYDRNRLLKSVLAFRDGTGEVPALRLGFKSSGIRAVENFIQARFELFVQIYFHKTNQAVNLMLDEIAGEAAEGVDIFECNSVEDLVEMYIDLSDERLINVLRGHDPRWQFRNPKVNRLAEDLFERRLWKRIYEGDDCEVKYEKLANEFPSADLIATTQAPGAAKDLDKGAVILSRDASGVYCTRQATTWRKMSAVIEALAERETKICRVYLKSSDDELRKNLRELAFQLGGGDEA